MINTMKIVFILISVVSSNCLHAATTAFNYQGQVIYEGVPANGSFDVWFKLYDNPDSMAINTELVSLIQTVEIENGLLNTELDFGDIFFNGQDLWIQLAIEKPNGPPGFFVLMPRIPINSAPYAIQSQFIADGNIDSAAIANNSVLSEDIGNGQVTNTQLADSTIDFSKFAANGASGGEFIQYTGSGWNAVTPIPIAASPWTNNSPGISYSSGNVGIGTSVPASKLNIYGNESNELRLSGLNSTPSLHFRRDSNGADWYLKIDPSTNQFHFQADAVTADKIMTIKTTGEITRKKQTRTTFVSYKSFIPTSNVVTYSTFSFSGFTGLRSTNSIVSGANFHADVSLPVDAVITQVSMIAGDNTTSGSIATKFGYRVFGSSNVATNLSTLVSTTSPSPFGGVTSNALNHTVGNDRNYFLDVDIDNVTTPGQEVLFGGIRITYETTTL